MFADRVQQVKAKVAALIAQYEARHPGQKVPQMDIRFDLRGRAAGQAGRKGWNYFMRFNRDMMMNASWDHLFNDTVPHELAHVICFANGTDRGHGVFWKRTCIELGGTGQRCHSEDVTYAKGRTYVYTTSTGRTINVSETKHQRIQTGSAYLFKDRSMGRIDFTCAYSQLGDATVIKPIPLPTLNIAEFTPKPAVQPKPVVSRDYGTSKADLVRGRIMMAKRNGEGSSVVVNYAVTTLGMSLSLAKTYVKNNWNRV